MWKEQRMYLYNNNGKYGHVFTTKKKEARHQSTREYNISALRSRLRLPTTAMKECLVRKEEFSLQLHHPDSTNSTTLQYISYLD